MPTKKSQQQPELATTRLTRTMYFFIAIFALSIVIFDSGNLITREAVVDRWSLATILLVINTIIWFMASKAVKNTSGALVTLLASVLLVFAGFMTYWERGMASTSTILYALPLLIIATLKNRHALLAYTALAVGTYAFAAVKYFNDFFNEGFRIQLYGSIVLYGGIMFVISWLIMVLTGLRADSK